MSDQKFRYFETIAESELRSTVRAWKGQHPAMGVFAMLPESEKGGVAALQKLFREEGVPLMGAIFPALVMNDSFRTAGVWLLRLDVMPRYTLIDDLKNPGGDPAKRISEAVSPFLAGERDKTLFLVFDAMVPNISTILDNLYLLLADRISYAGVNAGSETFQPMPCLFDENRIVGDGVLLILMEHNRGAILEHGFREPEELITATSTEGNRIISIDWRPAFDVYRDVIRERFHVEVTPENFYRYASHFPFGIVRANNELVIRIPVAIEKDGSVFCVGEVPPNAMLTLLEAPQVDSKSTVRDLVSGLIKIHGSLEGKDLLLFYCAGRRLFLEERAGEELQDLVKKAGTRLVAGALSLGEIGSSLQGGYPLFHNATLVGCGWERE